MNFIFITCLCLMSEGLALTCMERVHATSTEEKPTDCKKSKRNDGEPTKNRCCQTRFIHSATNEEIVSRFCCATAYCQKKGEGPNGEEVHCTECKAENCNIAWRLQQRPKIICLVLISLLIL